MCILICNIKRTYYLIHTIQYFVSILHIRRNALLQQYPSENFIFKIFYKEKGLILRKLFLCSTNLSRSEDLFSRRYDLQARMFDISSRTYQILSRYNDFLSHTDNLVSCTTYL